MIKDKSNNHEMYKDNNLDWAIKSLKYNAKLNKNNQFHLITNYECLKDKFINQSNILIHNYEDYIDDNMKEFNDLYIHLSTNYYDFEKNSILGYMMLNDFCKKNNIDKFFHIETDILLFTNCLDDDFKFFTDQNYCLTLMRKMGAGASFFDLRKHNMLQKFSEYIISTYSSDINKKPKCFDMGKTKIYYQESLDKKLMRGGVSDMHFWNYIYETNKDIVFGNMETPINNIIYHQNLNIPSDKILQKEKEILKLKIEKNKCYGFAIYDNQPIEIKMLHFHGHWKQKIKDYINE